GAVGARDIDDAAGGRRGAGISHDRPDASVRLPAQWKSEGPVQDELFLPYLVEAAGCDRRDVVSEAVEAHDFQLREAGEERRVRPRIFPPQVHGEVRPDRPGAGGVARLECDVGRVRHLAESVLIVTDAGAAEYAVIGGETEPRQSPPLTTEVAGGGERASGVHRGRVGLPIDVRGSADRPILSALVVEPGVTHRVDEEIVAFSSDDAQANPPGTVAPYDDLVVATIQIDP